MEAAARAAPQPRRRNDKGRRCWSTREEEVLLSGLKEIIAKGWKSENGFRVGYLQALEAFMCKEFPGTDLKATPHINSKIHGWKKNYGSLFTMLSRSGIGWNGTTKMIESTDEAWENYVKVDSNAKLMRFKSWPFYEDWCEIFGRDRATGQEAEGFADAINGVLNSAAANSATDNFFCSGYERIFDEVETTPDNMSVSQASPSSAPSCTGKKSSGKKRKAIESGDQICEVLSAFCKNTDLRLGEIAKRIGYEHDLAASRKEVWTVVERFEGLSLNDKLLASTLLVKSAEDLVLFFTLPPHAREEFVLMKLAGKL